MLLPTFKVCFPKLLGLNHCRDTSAPYQFTLDCSLSSFLWSLPSYFLIKCRSYSFCCNNVSCSSKELIFVHKWHWFFSRSTLISTSKSRLLLMSEFSWTSSPPLRQHPNHAPFLTLWSVFSDSCKQSSHCWIVYKIW